MSNKTKFLIISSVLVLGIWFYFAPYLALFNMKSAAESKDAIRLSSYVNFPALKENLKASVNAKLASKAVEKNDNPFGMLGMALAAAFINPMIDGLVTPESLAMMMKGDKPQAKAVKQKSSDTGTGTNVDTDMSMSYEDFDHFVVTIKKKGDADEPFSFVLNREGLFSWKLSALRIPF